MLQSPMPLDFAKCRHVVLDMDGTIYLGSCLLPDTLPFLQTLSSLAIGYSFVTNNCSRSRASYAARLRELGIAAGLEQIRTSADATIFFLRGELPQASRLFVLGTPELHDELRAADFQIVDQRPDAVVVGFDTKLTYDRLAQSAYWIAEGLPYVATHPDRVCPTDRPIVLPDCGAICALLESATGRRPDAIPGKPSPAMLESICKQQGLSPREVAMVGDRLYTDVRMARDAGALAVLTLTGETQLADVEACGARERPDLVVADLGELATMLQEARNRG